MYLYSLQIKGDSNKEKIITPILYRSNVLLVTMDKSTIRFFLSGPHALPRHNITPSLDGNLNFNQVRFPSTSAPKELVVSALFTHVTQFPYNYDKVCMVVLKFV
jgi:hypothetical protein